jgi:hypothetical protein
MGNTILGGTSLSVTDNSGTHSNYYFAPADNYVGQRTLLPTRSGVNDRFIFSSNGSLEDCYVPVLGGSASQACAYEEVDLHALSLGATGSGIEENWRGGPTLGMGFYGHAPLTLGNLNSVGGSSFSGSMAVSLISTPSAPTLSCNSSGSGTSLTYYLVAHDYHGNSTLPSSAGAIQCPNAPSSSNPVTIWPPVGQITGVGVNAGGTGYAVGNTVGIYNDQYNMLGMDAVLTVTSVGTGGAVTGLSITNAGVGYAHNSGVLTTGALTGSGSGLTVSITVLAPLDGVGSWDILKGNTSTSLLTGVRCSITSPCQDTGQSTTAYTAPTRNSTGDATIAGNLTVSGTTTIYGQPYDLPIFYAGLPGNAQLLSRVTFTRAVTFAAGLTTSQGSSGEAATSSAIVTFNKNGTSFGTCTFAASANTCTFASPSGASFAPGDVLTVLGPGTADATLGDIAITIVGSR